MPLMGRKVVEVTSLSLSFSDYLPTYLPIYLCIYLCIYLSIYRSICRSLSRSLFHLSIYPSIHPSIYLSLSPLSLSLSVCLSIYLAASLKTKLFCETTSRTKQFCSSRPRTNKFCDFATPFVQSAAPATKNWCQIIPSAALVTQNHLSTPEELRLQNATPLKKSAPGPPNISDEHVSCTAPATENASLQTDPLQMSHACHRLWKCYKPSRFAHFWQRLDYFWC